MAVSGLTYLFIALLSSYVVSEVLKQRFSIPRVVGQISAGILIGLPVINAEIGSANAVSIIQFMSQIGVVLLFFFIGLQLGFPRFRQNLRESLLISFWNTVPSLLIGFGIGKLFGFDDIASAIIGFSVAVSAQSVAFDLLDELRLVGSRIGLLLITAGMVSDMVQLALVTFIFTLLGSSITGMSLTQLVMGFLAFVGVISIAKFLIVPWLLRFFESEEKYTHTSLFTGAVVIALFIASLSDLLGFGSLIGALLGGMLVRQTLVSESRKPWEEHSISKMIHLVSFGFFIPVFFFSIGLNTSVSLIAQNLPFAILVSLLSIVGTVFGTMIGVRMSGASWKEGQVLGWGLTAKGDVELVILSVALGAGVISQSLFSALIFMTIATTLVGPVMFKRLLVQDGKRGKKRK